MVVEIISYPTISAGTGEGEVCRGIPVSYFYFSMNNVFLYRDTRVDYFIMEDPKGALRSTGIMHTAGSLAQFFFLFFAFYSSKESFKKATRVKCRLSRACHKARQVAGFQTGYRSLLLHVYGVYVFSRCPYPTLPYSPQQVDRSLSIHKEIKKEEKKERKGVHFIIPHRPPVLYLCCPPRRTKPRARFNLTRSTMKILVKKYILYTPRGNMKLDMKPLTVQNQRVQRRIEVQCGPYNPGFAN